jgi:hypothetical protein
MQSGYRYYRSAPMGEAFDSAFQPDLSPAKMLELGVFCGKYMTDCRGEFPAEWFTKAKLAASRGDCSLNYFGVRAGSSLRTWREKGWIHPDDPRGWFQWYCRYYAGRRLGAEDQRQIGRWRAFRRHAAQVQRYCEPGRPARTRCSRRLTGSPASGCTPTSERERPTCRR